MTREELIKDLEALGQSVIKEHPAVASILFGLCGSLCLNEEGLLMHVVHDYV